MYIYTILAIVLLALLGQPGSTPGSLIPSPLQTVVRAPTCTSHVFILKCINIVIMAQRAPKQWSLTENETITSYESWRQNLLYCLSLDDKFAPYLADGATWSKKSAASPYHGLVNDAQGTPNGLTAAQKNAHLELMLGQIANFCPGIARNAFVKESTSLDDVWQKIRLHLGFQRTGGHFLDLATIKLEPDERPEALYQRLCAFYQDNMLSPQSQITHHGSRAAVEEDMTPSLENTIVFLWLQLIHPGLPQLVKQRYGAELRNKSLASLKPEISLALTSLLDELRMMEESRAFRSTSNSVLWSSRRPQNTRSKPSKMCTLCKAAGRKSANTHWLQDCTYLPERDKKALARARYAHEDDYDDDVPEDDADNIVSTPDDDSVNLLLDVQNSARRVSIMQSPTLKAFYGPHPLVLTLDCGATSNMIRATTAKQLGLPIQPATQGANQADGRTPLSVVGETHIFVTRGNGPFS